MTSLLANFFKRNVTLNMGAIDERRPQTAYISAREQYAESLLSKWGRSTNTWGYDRTYDKMYVDESSYLKEQIMKAYGLSAEDIYGDKKAQPEGVWNMPYDKPAYYKPTVNWLVKCPYCGKQYYLLSDSEKCEHWDGNGWYPIVPKRPDPRFGYQFKEEFEKKFPDDIYPDGYRSDTDTKKSKENDPPLAKDAMKNSRRGRIISGNGKITSGFDWE